VRDIGAIQKQRWVSLRLSEPEGPDDDVLRRRAAEPGGPNGRLRDELDALCLRGIAPSLERFVRTIK